MHIFLFETTWVSKKFMCRRVFPANNYLFKVNNRNTRKRCEICSKLTIKTRKTWTSFCFFTVNFEHVSNLFLMSLVDFEHVNVS